MLFLDLTLPSVAENLALDEALLEEADQGPAAGVTAGAELLRLWQADTWFVVLGRSSRYQHEVYVDQARQEGVPIYRRVSGGASVLAGPGCMFYSVLLSLEKRPELRMLDAAHQFVMGTMTAALRPLVPGLQFDGTCDLVLDGKKVSGNSVRVVRNWMLYHGSLLLDMDISRMDRLLQHPPREPEYRQARRHSSFVTNLELTRDAVARALRLTWKATESLNTIPRQTMDRLIRDKYSQDAWNQQR